MGFTYNQQLFIFKFKMITNKGKCILTNRKNSRITSIFKLRIRIAQLPKYSIFNLTKNFSNIINNNA